MFLVNKDKISLSLAFAVNRKLRNVYLKLNQIFKKINREFANLKSFNQEIKLANLR